MIYILHGDDIVSSRKRLTSLTSGVEPIIITSDKSNFLDIQNALQASDLFVEKKCVLVEHIFKLSKSDFEKALLLFEKVASDNQTMLILWQNSQMTKLQISKFKKAVVESFVMPKLFFTFLDNFSPKNLEFELQTLSHMTNIDEMQIFYALVKRIRQLFMIKTGGNFEELLKMSPWQKEKLEKQAYQWKENELENAYADLFDLEKKIKSSGLFLPLRKHLDIMLVSALH